MDHLAEVGVGAIVALLIIKEVLGFLKTRRSGDGRCPECFRLVQDLHKMHSVKDQDGVPVWYVRRSMETAIDKLAENIQTQTLILQKLTDKLDTR